MWLISLPWQLMTNTTGWSSYPAFCSMKWQQVYDTPPGGLLVYHSLHLSSSSIQFGTNEWFRKQGLQASSVWLEGLLLLRRSGLTEGNFEVQILAVAFSCILRSSCANLSLTEALCPLVVKASMEYWTAWTIFNPLTSRSNLKFSLQSTIQFLC